MTDDRIIPDSIEPEPGDSSRPAVQGDQLFPEQDDDYARVREPITAKRVAIVGGRVVTGIVGIAVAAAAIAAATLLPLPSVTAVPASLLVTPVPTAQQLVCPGSILRLADDQGQGATTASAIGRPQVDSSSSTGGVDAVALEQSDASTGGTNQAPTVISTPPNPADPTAQILISGAQYQEANEGDFVGATGADCGSVSGDTWLSAGSTAVGRTTLLTLSNPTEVPAAVNIELYGEAGPITAPGTSGIVVPASGQRVLSLAGFSPDVNSPVVHVTSTGGQVVAQLQPTTVRGLVPGGIDIAGSTVAPQLETIIPGLVVSDIVAVQELQAGGESFDDLRTVVRLFAPGEGTVSTTISVIPEDGVGEGASFAYDLDAGRVVDLPVGDLDNGNYTVKVVASAPTLASVRVSAAAGEVTDFAWLVSAPELPLASLVTIADGPAPLLHLVNPTTADLTVTIGDTQVVVPAGTASIATVEGGQSYPITASAPGLRASVSLGEGAMTAGYVVRPPGVGSSDVLVYR